jgi:hypothetical protein
MEEAKIKISVAQSSGDKFEVEISPKATVEELKKACATKQSSIAADEMRLIFKGKILKDEMTLDEYKITTDGLTVHLVKGKAAGGAATETSSTSTASAGAAAGGAAGAGFGAAGAGQPNPFAGMGGMGGMGGFGGGGMGGHGGYGGMGGNPYGGMGGMPNP